MQIPIIKCHGSENDFIMIDEISNELNFSEEQRVAISQAMCDRKGKLGADGILFVVSQEGADGMMRMFNPDGSEAKMCGNGIRCVGRKVYEITGKEAMKVDTIGGMQYITKVNDFFGDLPAFSVEMQNVNLEPEKLPMTKTGTDFLQQPLTELSAQRTFTSINLGNSHLLSIVEDVNTDELEAVGSAANENKTLLPEGANVSFCKPLQQNRVYVGTFERGAGLTNSCGTGMSAATLAACLAGEVDFGAWVDVYNAGGMVKCKGEKLEKGLKVHLLGNATYTFTADIAMDFEQPKAFEVQNQVDFPEEISAYQALKEKAIAELA